MVVQVSFLTSAAVMEADQIVSSTGAKPTNAGSGRARLFLDQASGNLLIFGSYTPLSSELAERQTNDTTEHPSAAHLHAAPRGDSGGVVRHMHATQNATFDGKIGTDTTLDARAMRHVVAGNGYALIHTKDNFGGEIRGQFDILTTVTGLLGDADDEAITGTRGNDVIMALAGADRVTGGAGNDVLSGGAGDDLLHGGTGADDLIGGDGDDAYYVDDARDLVYEFEEGGTDTVYASLTYLLQDVSVEHLRLTGADAIDGTGTERANDLYGNAAANTLSGLEGDDRLMGGDGADRLLGAAGRDRLLGGDGDDMLLGGAGVDTLVGGAGADMFVFVVPGDSGASGRDRVSDFVQGADRIDLSAMGVTSFSGSRRFSGADGEVIAVAGNGYTIVSADLDGDRQADFSVMLQGFVAPLGASDFVF